MATELESFDGIQTRGFTLSLFASSCSVVLIDFAFTLPNSVAKAGGVMFCGVVTKHCLVSGDRKCSDCPRTPSCRRVWYHHERQKDDMRVEHELVWETNAYGDVTMVVRARYGKPKSDLSTVKARAAQQQHYITYTEYIYTKEIVGRNVDSYYGDACAWIPSPEMLWGHEGVTDADEVLNEARRSFFTPMRSRDAFGNVSSAKLDEYKLMAVQSTDAVKNVRVAEYDYRTMQAALLIDPNGNRTQIKYDHFGEVTMVARMGKIQEAVGDSLADVPHAVSDEDMLSFISRPTRDAAARLLESAGTRTLNCRTRLSMPSVQKTLPTFCLDLRRTQHCRDDRGEITISMSYLDGRGSQVQQIMLSDWSGTEKKWCVTEHNILDANGKRLLSVKPHYSSTHMYQSHVDSKQAYAVFFMDGLQREIGTLFADRTWNKTRFTPWTRTEYDAGDNVLVSDPRLDPDVGYYFATLVPALHTPSWHALCKQGDEAQQDAVTKSADYKNTPQETHFDSRGKEVEIVERGTAGSRTSHAEYAAFGNAIAETDFLGRAVVVREFDHLGRCHITRSMDSGVQLQQTPSSAVYDRLRRKVETWILDPDRNSEILWSKTTYGEHGLGGHEKNLRGHLEVSDQSGTRRSNIYDFKGNCLSTHMYIAQAYDTLLDWNGGVNVQQTPHTTLRNFDVMDRVNTLTDAAGRVSMRTYDLRGNLMSLSSSTTYALYSPEQQPLLVDYGNSSHAAYTYDEQTRRHTQRRTWRDDGTILENLTMSYDCLGRISRRVDSAHQTEFFRGTRAVPRKSYWYDSFGRLTKATGREAVQTGSNVSRSQQVISSSNPIVSQGLPFAQSTAISNYVKTYKYDDVDNIQAIQHQSSDPAVAGWKRTYQCNEPSLLEESHSNNRLSQIQIGGVTEEYKYDGTLGFFRLGWDCNNKLRCSARQRVNQGVPETTWYAYDEDGRRVRKVVARTVTDRGNAVRLQKISETIFLDSLEIYHTYKGDGQTAKTITKTSLINSTGSENSAVILNIENPVLIAEGSAVPDVPLFCYHVHEGLETDDHGQVISYEEYSPFGWSVLLACRSDIEAPRRFRFAAYQRDNETGLYACGARYYAPWLGRWASADPIGMGDGHNIYAYVRNDPVDWVDHTGNGKEDRRDGFRGDLDFNNPADRLALDEAIEKAEYGLMGYVEKAKHTLEQKKEEYALKLVTAIVGEAAGLIPIAGPVVKAVIDKLSSIYADKRKKLKEQKVAAQNFITGFRAAMKDTRKAYELEFIRIASMPNITDGEKLALLAASIIGTTAIDFSQSWKDDKQQDHADNEVGASGAGDDTEMKVDVAEYESNGTNIGQVKVEELLAGAVWLLPPIMMFSFLDLYGAQPGVNPNKDLAFTTSMFRLSIMLLTRETQT
ncbi:hypothetical protein CC86DRAFT_418118 [Ophiobolus disseminans]|uniref:RHS repeat-associated core domain-containing protein n=1 Tax=Ophiobolus disseminans TaxID=1469910 RepID=A0A6A6ZXT6_9PLEO|nr:hypothetical protein CC86DRAFT_418118 [Ophiobolus disseminans]